MITTDRLRQLFDYQSGQLIRKAALSKSSKVGEAIGWKHPDGYIYASVDEETYPLHHLIWMWHGNEPVSRLDHRNRMNSDNRIENLRPATHAQNMWNKGVQKNNTTGVKGVSWHKAKRKFRVRLGVNGKRIHIGDFDDLELAELVISEARAKYHGQFANS